MDIRAWPIWQNARLVRLLSALLFASVASWLLYLAIAHYYDDFLFAYLPFNLLLAWIPLGLGLGLVYYLGRHSWSGWPALALTWLWLLFLPNSFYIMTDFVHLGEVYAGDLNIVATLMMLFAFNGLILGVTSVYLVHRQLLRRVSERAAFGWVSLVLLLCSFAIYVGRDLRWNSWDVLANPAGLLFDLSDKLLSPSQYSGIAGTTLLYFVVLMTAYVTCWRLARLLSSAR